MRYFINIRLFSVMGGVHLKVWRKSIASFNLTDSPLESYLPLPSSNRWWTAFSKDLTGVLAYLDNVLVTGTTTEEHLEHLDKVLSKLNEPGLKHNKTKCIFMALSVEYLGHIMDKTGLHPSNKNKRSTNSYMCYRIENLLGIIKGYRMSLSEFIY